MIKRILDSRLPLIIYNPTRVIDKEFFVKCHEAGGLPVFDTEFINNEAIISIIDNLSRENIFFGIRINAKNDIIKDYLNNNAIGNLDVIVFIYDSRKDLKDFSYENKDYKIIIETRDIDIKDELENISPHGLILKGNEAPGRVSKFTSMILMQYYLENTSFPVFIHGGVGIHTAPGLFAAGASGIVLDDQLYLTDESPLSANFKELISNIKEGDSTVIGDTLEIRYRFFAKLGTKIVKDIKDEEIFIKEKDNADQVLYDKIKENIESLGNDSANPIQSLLYLGQDSVFALHFVKKSRKLKDVIYNLFENVSESLKNFDEFDPLVEDSPLAREHKTKYPVVMGPMANILDNAEFAYEVYDKGGLPFFAMGNLPKNLAENIISEGIKKFNNFGAGLIGTPEINKYFKDHLEIIKRYQVPFALIAVGIPAFVNALEAEGIKTYLHTPASQMLDNAIKNSCKRFIFEGTEAGGHIGSLTSFVLWEIAIEKLINQPDEIIAGQSALFAGGIASKSGSFFISGISVLLAKKGMKIGIQAGSPYLLTEEIVRTGAMKELYQKLLLERDETTVIGNSVGLSTRTIISPFSERMMEKEHQLVKEKVPLAERKSYFEVLNVGSLLIAAKAFAPDFEKLKKDGDLTYIYFNEDEHYDKGNFHTGESIAFYKKQIKIKDIHDSFFEMKNYLYENLNSLEVFSSVTNQINDEIAVIGMGCIYPDAGNIDVFWKNIISKKYSIKEAPKERFDNDLYMSPDRNKEDKSYTNLAGYIDYYEFDNKKYGYRDSETKHISRTQKMILDAAMQAVEHAGYLNGKSLPRNKTSVIIGSCLGNEYGDDMFLLMYYPELKYHLEQIEEFGKLSDEDKEHILESLKKGLKKGYSPKSPEGAALNVESSRIAKHLNLEGVNYTIDAACATSLAAVDNAQKELLSGDSDVVIIGGVHTNLSCETFVGFGKMGALSPDGSFPFDNRAGGFVLGEGAGVLVLKRVRDAIRDGDTIHAVIKGIGSSSDGKGKAIAAPKSEGQGYAVTRAFENSKTEISFSDVGYIEAHGTATLMGDGTEIKTLMNIYKSDKPIGVSSIKSQIGHLLGGAGAAGMIKAILAIKNKTLPPNGKYEIPSARFSIENTPFYIISEAGEWVARDEKPRMAGISSFGFGGINYHAIIGEYTDRYMILPRDIFRSLDYDFNDDRIVITGIGIIVPGSKNRMEFWNNLVTGGNHLSEIPDSRFHNRSYAEEKDPLFHIPIIKAGIVRDYKFNNLNYKIPPSTMMSIDRVQCFALDAAHEAIEQANMKDKLENGNKVGVIIGTASGEKHNENILRTRIPFIIKILTHIKGVDKSVLNIVIEGFEKSLKERYYKNTEDTIPGLLSNIVSGRIANYFNCNGPNYTIEAECASSAVGISVAIKDLKQKNVDYVIAGGADTNLTPANLMAFQMIKVLSPDENMIFDKRSKGLVMSEGAALMILTTYKKAKENKMEILGELSDISFNSYPAQNFIAPTTDGFTKVIDKYYLNNPYIKKQVDYIDVFASSHVVVDTWEKQAIENSYKHNLFFGNIKPEIGYLRAANPAVVISKLVLMGYNKKIPPNFSFSKMDTILDENSNLTGAKELIDLSKRDSVYLAANFSGLGGNHGHTVIRTLPGRFGARKASAKTEAYKRAEAMPVSLSASKVCALLSGQGAQFSGMMKELYDTYGEIKEFMDRGDEIFKRERGYSLLYMMFGQDSAINSTENTQPSVFLSTAAIYSFLKSRGFNPDYFIGHSVGEFSALYCAGMLSFDDAFMIILRRSEFMKQAAETEKGSIMVAFTGADEALNLIRESNVKNIYLANKNSETQTAVSGGDKEIDLFCSFLNSKNITNRKLNLSGAFHSPLFKSASEKLSAYIKKVTFNRTDYSRNISNVTAERYPDDPEKIKELLVRQLVSPVEFIDSVKYLSGIGVTNFIEIGPNRILVNLLKNISIKNYKSIPSVDPKKGEAASFKEFLKYLIENKLIAETERIEAVKIQPSAVPVKAETYKIPVAAEGENREYTQFLNENRDYVNDLLFKEFQYRKAGELLRDYSRFNFFTGKVVISGVSIGLPGKNHNVFDGDNFDRILSGENFIDTLPESDKKKMANKNVTRVFKSPDGSAKFQDITSTEDVIQLAGQLGYFDLKKEYGIDYHYDITYSLAIAAGIEALKDAGIPLVMNYQKTTTGNILETGYSLPPDMQENTGVIFASVFSSFESLIDEIYRFNKDQFYRTVYKDFESMYYFLMERVGDKPVKDVVTDWFYKIKDGVKDYKEYKFDRNILYNLVQMGAPFFAQLIKAKGPNTQINAACATSTQAVGVAEDWVRTGRCDRVIIIGGEAPTAEMQSEWISTGFLAIGAATVKKNIREAAKPFDKNRNGMLLGSGAVAMIVEREDSVKERGFNGQAEILGTFIKNSAGHASRLDVQHITQEMKIFFDRVKKAHDLEDDYADSLLFMSHETYTPARGGSADAEISALKHSFPNHYRNILITNTKGFTGHLLGVAVEDAVLVKALQKGIAPPIANLTDIPEHFADLKFSKGEKNSYKYGVHFSAGFGSQFSLIFIKRIGENARDNNSVYMNWLKRISNNQNPELKIINNTLCIVNTTPSQQAVKPSIDAVAEKQVLVPMEKRSGPGIESIISRIKNLIMEQTGYSMDMLDTELDLEADLGIDTVKQVEIFGKISTAYNLEVPEDLKLSELNNIGKIAVFIGKKVSVSADAPVYSTVKTEVIADGGQIIRNRVKEIIGEQTGYSMDMLDPELDLEADLGIDTVKQVEIFGKISSGYNLEVPEDLKLSELNTISKIAHYIGSRVAISVPAAAALSSTGISGGNAAMDSSMIIGKVKVIISEQTGYSMDMLDPELDLEADLGIDTVKQVEIFGKISSGYNLEVPEDLKLSELNTISRIASYIAGKTTGSASTQTVKAVEADKKIENESVDEQGPIKRFVVKMKKSNKPDKKENIFKGKKFLVSMDSFGFAERIIKRIKENNGKVITLGMEPSNDIICDLHDHETVRKSAEDLTGKSEGIDGFIHLYPLNSYFGNREADDLEIKGSIKSFFLLIKTLFKELNRAGNLISILSFDSIVFPYSGRQLNINPVFSGLSGMMKTINKEMENVLVKAVDFSFDNPLKNIDEITDLYINELMSGDKKVETGYDRDGKYVISLNEKMADKADAGDIMVKPGDTILVSGGARGITYEILKELTGKVSGIKLVLCGRSDIDKIDNAFLAPRADEKFIFNALKEKMKGAKPLEVKKAASNMMNIKETRANIDYLKAKGVNAEYHPVDVSDLKGLEMILKNYDRIDGVIHAAGIEVSNVMERKDLNGFSLVFDTKISGIMNLITALKGKRLRFMIGFSSVSAKFGNIGQVDYAAANDMLGKFLQREKQKNPDMRIKVFDWTAWKETGMATNESVRKVLLDNGIELLPVKDGVRFFMRDLFDNNEEVVITNHVPSFDKDGIFSITHGTDSNENYPFLGGLVEDTVNSRVFSRVLDNKKDIYLMHHVIEDVPLFLGATGIETMAEAAASMAGEGSRIRELADFSIPYGIKILRERPKEIMINAVRDEMDGNRFSCSIISQFRNQKGVPMGDRIHHYSGNYLFGRVSAEPPKIQIPEFKKVKYSGKFDELIYHPKRLFMDGLFKTIDDILSFDNKVLITRFLNTSDQRYFSHMDNPRLETDAIIIDGMFQTGGLFEFMTTNEIILPFKIRKMNFYGDVVTGNEYFCITEKSASGDKTNTYNLMLVDPDGNLYIKIQSFEMVRIGSLSPEHQIKSKFSF